MSTAVGNGVAIPHIRNPRENPVSQPVLVIGACPEGTAFGSLDGKPTYLFFLLAAENEVVHLRLVARLNQFLLQPGVIRELRSVGTSREIFDVLLREDTIYLKSYDGGTEE